MGHGIIKLRSRSEVSFEDIRDMGKDAALQLLPMTSQEQASSEESQFDFVKDVDEEESISMRE